MHKWSIVLAWWFLFGTGTSLNSWTITTSGPYETKQQALNAQSWIYRLTHYPPSTSQPIWWGTPYDDTAPTPLYVPLGNKERG